MKCLAVSRQLASITSCRRVEIYKQLGKVHLESPWASRVLGVAHRAEANAGKSVTPQRLASEELGEGPTC